MGGGQIKQHKRAAAGQKSNRLLHRGLTPMRGESLRPICLVELKTPKGINAPFQRQHRRGNSQH